MKAYQCHKQVRAAKIVCIEDILSGRNDQTCTLRLDDGTTRKVDFGWTWRNDARVGNYFVEYQDGHTACWTPETFNAGYTLVEGE